MPLKPKGQKNTYLAPHHAMTSYMQRLQWKCVMFVGCSSSCLFIFHICGQLFTVPNNIADCGTRAQQWEQVMDYGNNVPAYKVVSYFAYYPIISGIWNGVDIAILPLYFYFQFASCGTINIRQCGRSRRNCFNEDQSFNVEESLQAIYPSLHL